MDRRFDTRLREMWAQAQVSPELTKGLRSRLETFVEPFTASLAEPEQRRHTVEYLTGLLSKLKHKTGEGIAYLHDQERQGLPKFLGLVPGNDQSLLRTLARQVGADLGQADGVIVFDPSAFAKKGTASVGVQRPWCGRLGKKENCQVGVYMASVSCTEHAIVNTRLSLPNEGTQDRRRCQAAGVPKMVPFRTRHELALEMREEQGAMLPHTWVAGDDEMGRPTDFRLKWRGRGERYLLAVPSNTRVRDGDAAPPEYAGHGPHPQNPFVRVDRWCAALPESAGRTIQVRDGEKGPLTAEVVKCGVRARTPTGGTGRDEVLFLTRERQANGTFQHDYYLSNADPQVPLKELSRVAQAAHRIEDGLKRAQGEAGLGDDQVRNWIAWHHHQTRALLAAWFRNQETRRGKNPDPCAEHTAHTGADRGRDRSAPEGQRAVKAGTARYTMAGTKRVCSVLLPSFS
jgi:SRSO17 transposase